MKTPYFPFGKFLRNPNVRVVLGILFGSFLAASSDAASIYYWNTATGTWSTGANWSDNAVSGGTTGVVPLSTDSVVFNQSSVNGAQVVSLSGATSITGVTFNNTGTTTINGSGNQNFTTLSGGITLGATSGAVTIGSATANTNVFAIIGDNQTWTNNSSSALLIRNSAKGLATGTVPVTLTINAAGTGSIGDSGALDNGAAGAPVSLVIASTGSGVTSITGGSYSGGTAIKSGALSSSGSFGAGAVTLGDTTGSANATLTLNSSGTIANNITVQSGNSGTLTISNNGGTNTPTLSGSLTLNKAVTFNAGSTGTITLTGALSGSGDITVNATGAGTLAFNRGATSFTLANNINGTGGLTQSGSGTLTLTGATGATTTYTGTTKITSGTLKLDFDAAGAPSSNILASTSVLTLGGGTLSLNGKSSGASSQTIGNLTLSSNTVSGITLNNNGGGGTSLTLGNTWTRTAGGGGILAIDLSAGGTLTSNPTASASNNVLGFATVKDSTSTGFALLSGGNIVRLSGQGALLTTGNVSTTNYLQTAAGTTFALSGAQSVNSLEINTAADSGTLDLGAGTLTITSKGLLMSGANNYTIQNGQLGANASEVVIHQLGAGTLTVAGTISNNGAGALTTNGTGTIILTGANAYTGATNINTGSTLQLGNAGTSGTTGTGAIVNNGTLAFNRTDSFTVSSVISGAGNVTQNGSGTTILTGGSTTVANNTNSYTGTTTLNSGTLQGRELHQGSDVFNPFGTSAIVLNGGTLQLRGNGAAASNRTLTATNSVTIGSSSVTIDVNQTAAGWTNNSLGFSGAFSLGSGQVNVTGANGYFLRMTGATTLTGNATLNPTTANLNLGGIIGETGGARSITKIGAGTLNISGVNTYTGGTNINGGTVSVFNAAALGTTGAISFGGGTLQYNGITTDLSNRFSTAAGQAYSVDTNTQNVAFGTGLTSSGATFTKLGTGTLTLTGASTFSGATTISGGTLALGVSGSLGGGNYAGAITNNGALSIATTGGTQILSGNIGGSGNLSKSGAGALTLSGTNNYGGTTALSAGTLNVNNVSALGSGTFTITGGTLDNTSGSAITSQTNNPAITLSADFTFGTAGSTANNSLNLGNGAITTAAARTITILGTSNTLTFGGVLTYTGSAAVAANGLLSSPTAGNTLVLGGLNLSSSNVAPINILISNGAGNITFNGPIANGAGAAGNSLSYGGTGTLTLSGTGSSYTGATTVSTGTVAGVGSNAFGSSSGISVAAAGTLSLRGDTDTVFVKASDNTTRYAVTTTASGATINVNQATGAGTAAKTMTFGTLGTSSTAATYQVNFTGANNTSLTVGAMTGAASTAAGTVTISNAIAGGGALTLASYTSANTLGGETVTFTGVGNTTVTGAITPSSTALALSKNGAGTLTLTGPNTYTGTTTITAGTVQIGNGGTAGVLGGGSVANSGLLVFKRSDAISVANNITGTGAVTQDGGSSLTLGGTSTFSGGLNINTGSVISGSATTNGGIGSGTVTMANTTSLDLGNNTLTTGLLSTSGDGTGVSVTNATGTAGAKTLTISGTGTQTFAGVISDGTATSLALIKSGAGSQTFTAANSYTGGTTLAAGTLSAGHNSSLGSGDITVTGASTLQSSSATDRVFSNNVIFSLASGTVTLNLGSAITGNLAFGTYSGAGAGGARTLAINNAQTTFTDLTGTVGFTSAGTGALFFGNYTGSTAAVNIANSNITGFANGIPTAANLGNISVNNGGVLGTNGTISRTLGTAGVNTRFAFLGSGGFAGYGTNGTFGNPANNLVVQLGGGGTLTFGSANMLASGQALVLGNALANGTVDFQNGLGLAGATQTVKVDRSTLATSADIDATISGVISSTGTGNLTKTGAGSLALTNTNTYTGVTTVSAGTLLVSGSGSVNTSSGISVTGGTFKYSSSVALTSNVSVNGGRFSYNSGSNYAGTLTFTSGTVGGSNLAGVALSIGTGQIMAPGNSTGTLAAGATTWDNGGTFVFELNNATGTAGSTSQGWDLLNASTLDVTAGAGQFTLQIVSLDTLQAAGLAQNFSDGSNYSWLFADAGATITGFSASQFVLDATAFQNTHTGSFSISQGTGINDDKLYLNYTAVPEPATWGLLAGGLTVVTIFRRRRA